MRYHYFTLEQRNALSDVIRSRAAEPGMVAAYFRMRMPEFGVCEACGADIPFVQLMSNPLLRRCARCPGQA